MTVNVLFVCLGNICRSPTAQAVFDHKLRARGLAHQCSVDSAGTGAWHAGSAPDERSQQALRARQIDMSGQRARQVTGADFQKFDWIVAMDNSNLADLQAQRPADFVGHLNLFLEFGNTPTREVPDPYYGGAKGFEQVIDLIEAASDGLIEHLLATDRLKSR